MIFSKIIRLFGVIQESQKNMSNKKQVQIMVVSMTLHNYKISLTILISLKQI